MNETLCKSVHQEMNEPTLFINLCELNIQQFHFRKREQFISEIVETKEVAQEKERSIKSK
jgi:hypothetical protein